MRIETRIALLRKEISEDELYTRETDPQLVVGMLERKRDDMVRMAVLQLHTSIEDLLTVLILYSSLEITKPYLKHRLRGERAAAYRKLLYGTRSIGFDAKITLAVGLGLITKATQAKLAELNSLRNKCSHNWILKAVVRRGRRPKQPKLPLLSFRGRDLHKVTVLKDFICEFATIYVRIYAQRVQ